MRYDKALTSINSVIKKIIDKRHPVLRGLFNDSSLGRGKMLRARLFFDFSQSASGAAVKIAAALELLHMATLIHDDVLDESTLRRDRTTLYIKRGTATSLLYGDYLFSQCFRLAAGLGDPMLCREIADALSELLKGEIEEQDARGRLSLTKKGYFAIISKKTGALFGTAAKLGAIMKRGNGLSAGDAYRFGASVGMAYQILDDCDDYLGSGQLKRRFDDIKQGVITLPLLYLLDRCAESERARIAGMLADPSSREPLDFAEIVRLMNHYGAISGALAAAGSILRRAKKALKPQSLRESSGWTGAADWVEEKIENVKKEYCDSGRRVRGGKSLARPAPL